MGGGSVLRPCANGWAPLLLGRPSLVRWSLWILPLSGFTEGPFPPSLLLPPLQVEHQAILPMRPLMCVCGGVSLWEGQLPFLRCFGQAQGDRISPVECGTSPAALSCFSSWGVCVSWLGTPSDSSCPFSLQVAHPLVQKQLVDYIHNGFLVPVMGPALHKVRAGLLPPSKGG